jgi:hypothetical protein
MRTLDHAGERCVHGENVEGRQEVHFACALGVVGEGPGEAVDVGQQGQVDVDQVQVGPRPAEIRGLIGIAAGDIQPYLGHRGIADQERYRTGPLAGLRIGSPNGHRQIAGYHQCAPTLHSDQRDRRTQSGDTGVASLFDLEQTALARQPEEIMHIRAGSLGEIDSRFGGHDQRPDHRKLRRRHR